MTVQLALLCYFAGTASGAGGVYLLVRRHLRVIRVNRAMIEATCKRLEATRS